MNEMNRNSNLAALAKSVAKITIFYCEQTQKICQLQNQIGLLNFQYPQDVSMRNSVRF